MMCFPHLCLECMSFPVYNVFTRSALLPLTIRREKTVRGIQTVCESQHRVLSPQTILLSLDQSIVHKMPTFQILQELLGGGVTYDECAVYGFHARTPSRGTNLSVFTGLV